MRSLLCVATMLVACGSVQKIDVDANPPDADPCATAACACTVATESTDCGAHQYCDTTGPGRSCQCVAGYSMGAAGCAWTGSVQDPGFQGTAAWTVAHGALLNPTATGGIEAGEVSYVASALCGLGTVTQTVEMPTFAKAEPLVLELSYKDPVTFGMGFESIPFGVSLGGGWASLPSLNDGNFHTVRLCLGEGGYAPAGTTGKGAMVPVTLGPYNKSSACPNSTVPFSIDHANIVVANAGECGARPGIGPNYDAEGTGGWTFTTSGSQSGGGFIPGIGVSGSKAARITLGQRCDGAAMSTTVSVPMVTNPALDMYVGVTANAIGFIDLGDSTGSLPFPTSSGMVHACLPPALRGQVASLSASLTGGSGLCSDVINSSLWMDNVQVVEDPACGTSDAVDNPGFEQGGTALGGFGSTGNGSSILGAGSIKPSNPHGGTYAFEIDSYGPCSSEGINKLVTVPQPSGSSGPAVTLYAKVANDASATFSARAGTSSTTLPNNSPYAQYKLCLDPAYAGRPLPVTIAGQGGAGTCSPSGGAQSAWVDDIAVTTDPSCPAM